MRTLDLVAGTEIVPEPACWEMLATQSIGRIVFLHEGRVEVFPVNYALHGSQILFATNHGRKLTGLGGEVAFEVDWVDPESRTGWSVIVRGTAHRVGEGDHSTADTVGQDRLSWAGTKDFVVLVQPQSITGRRVAPI